MATIKKAFQPIMTALATALANELIAPEVFNEVEALAAAKTGSGGGKASTFHRNEAGEVVAVRCWHFGVWMDPRVAEFGEKKSSPSGLNSMCKEGVSAWNKQQRSIKSADADILAKVMSGELSADDIADAQADAKKAAQVVEPREDGYGFETLEECLEDSAERGLE